MPRSIRPHIGDAVRGDGFWPRTATVDQLARDLGEGRGSRRLFGLRRIGKSSVLMEVERRLRADRALTVIRMDVQDTNRFSDFLEELFEKIPQERPVEKFRQRIASNPAFQRLFAAVCSRIAGVAVDTTATANFASEFDHRAVWAGDIEAALVEAGPVVLLIDELPFMLRNMLKDGYRPADLERFLATLRSWRNNAGVRMLLSGSLGLGHVQRSHGVAVQDHVNDVPSVDLPPLERDDAIDFVDALAVGGKAKGWSRALSQAIVDTAAERWPIFLQYGYDAVERSGVRDPAGIAAVIERDVVQKINETFYSQFRTRLMSYETSDLASARAILRLVAAGTGPVPFEAIDGALQKTGGGERRDDLLEWLREDNFIVFDTAAQTVRPASGLIETWVRAQSWGR